jgi:hypothetical protein
MLCSVEGGSGGPLAALPRLLAPAFRAAVVDFTFATFQTIDTRNMP